jgi:hypothetical protein
MKARLRLKVIFGLFFALMALSFPVQGNEVGATFILRLNEILRTVDPGQKLQDELLEARLRELLGRAQKLRREHHLSRQKGLKGSVKVKALEREGRELITEVLEMTESYLESRLKSLRKNREALIDALMPVEEN